MILGAGRIETTFDVGDFEMEIDFRLDAMPKGMTGIRVRDTSFLLFKDPALNSSCGMYDPKTGDAAVLSGGGKPLGEWKHLYIRCFVLNGHVRRHP